MEARYLFRYLSSAPVVATLALIIISVILIVLNYLFPGLQYGTFFHSLP
ncbi:photosystem I reaction centre subunit IX / PsaJ [Fischerella thermalis]|jgi:hypothetical protein|uniref:Photosystem I reaction centre subunit IX / PsaJ n=4 Tax=Fischerella TaxID=1190 RepID=G6FMD2_9CYAN|nr:photosystem I reaction centre subunit IX / PsaJ [Fischerella thermalis]6PNJ_J Chain J, Photosystem I reaction centre subunit IX / PsaJ [Fischerella thermalis PCC 7521]6PNJ_S Chain S, Photosystem I reaction centre subunit IX / PsaJ [Fischerella thermalis PCC 7521]6PNJ_j Chain j, Photosystem I reaction centre subunit IX / PsaJ [Fischerella thermalis PCC 7521]7LX0_J Chain J, Photosystem I reaction centre subunit IX / PsaJ [Fischerella thermalis PCC 7521]7LX0_S Chain S, Photosystem I reaction c